MTDLFVAFGMFFARAFPVEWSPEVERIKYQLRRRQSWRTTGRPWYRR